MAGFVIDTNVPIVANGDNGSIRLECRTAAVELLLKATRKGMIFLDTAGEIQKEYQRHLNPKGQPGVGDRFYLEVINSDPKKVTRVEVTRREDGEYHDVPQPLIDAGFDPSDRKFVAVAVRSGSQIYNAVDSDWVTNRTLIEAHGISVVFLCGCDPSQWTLVE